MTAFTFMILEKYMSIISNSFFLFVFAGLILYYYLPKRFQSVVLLLISIAFYLSYGIIPVIYLIATIFITYIIAIWIENTNRKINDDTFDKAKAKKVTRWILILGMILDFGLLGFLKYTNFIIDNVNYFTGNSISHLDLLLPLGISYYIFQSVGYMLDVYWKRANAERNILRFSLFISYFPYMIQGPINRFGNLSTQLNTFHFFDWKNIRYGVVRILWGLFKKMVLADWAAIFRAAIFANPDKYSGIAIFGVLLYSVELYGNFSGGIDIVLGVSRMFDIQMEENFKRPFFSVSITDFWHRWHITLGTWMKDYVFYPLTLSKTMKKCGKGAKKIFGKKTGRNIPICISNIIVFFIVGIWHGPTWSNILWGLYNGLIIAFSGLAIDLYKKSKDKLHINDKSKGWHLFTILRTFALVNLSWYFDCTTSFKDAFTIIKYSVTRFDPSQFLLISAGKQGTAYTPYAIAILLVGIAVLFTVSVIQEKGHDIQEELAAKPVIFQGALYGLLLIAVLALAPMASGGGFIYAQF